MELGGSDNVKPYLAFVERVEPWNLETELCCSFKKFPTRTRKNVVRFCGGEDHEQRSKDGGVENVSLQTWHVDQDFTALSVATAYGNSAL